VFAHGSISNEGDAMAIEFKPTVIDLGYLPGDERITEPGGLSHLGRDRDVSLERVLVSARELESRPGVSWWRNGAGDPFVAAGDVGGASLWSDSRRERRDHRAALALAAEVVNNKSRDEVATDRINGYAAAANTRLDQLEASRGNAYVNYTLSLKKDTTTAAAASVQALHNLWYTLIAKSFGTTVVAAARTAVDAATARFNAFESAIASSIETMQAGIDARKTEFTFTEEELTELVRKFTKAKSERWVFGYNKELSTKIDKVEEIIHELISYGEIWIGHSATDPQLTKVSTRAELLNWVRVATGTTEILK
jgi:hypothetical protein